MSRCRIHDIDIVADLRPQHVAPLVEAIEADYYVSVPAVRAAVRGGTSFNVIHMNAAVKVDVFVAGGDPFEEERLRARQRIEVSSDPVRSIFLDTAAYSVLRKLEWFRRGGETSERQWRDVVAMLRVQGDLLDDAGMRGWADRLGVADLLERARREASSG